MKSSYSSQKLYQAYVFDFDGTLADSNEIKYQAYYDIFPNEREIRIAISKVLKYEGERSRYYIIDQILRQINQAYDEKVRESLVEKYGDIVLEKVKTCPEIESAHVILSELSKSVPLFISSNTPEIYLKEIIEFRGWADYITRVFGYPREKSATLRSIIDEYKLNPSLVLVVGDGKSDQLSAQSNGCDFFLIDTKSMLKELLPNH